MIETEQYLDSVKPMREIKTYLVEADDIEFVDLEIQAQIREGLAKNLRREADELREMKKEVDGDE